MPFKVQVGPPQIAIHQGQTVLVSEPDGQINWPSDKGLYFFDTRDRQQLDHLRQRRTVGPAERRRRSPTTPHASSSPIESILTEDGAIAPRTLGLTISRSISGGMHEDLDITNNGMKPVRFQLEIALRCDFADIFEVKSGHIVRRGQITTEWSRGAATAPHRAIATGDFTAP